MAERVLLGTELPARLLDLESPPERLFLHGRWPDGPVVAVVGTRSPSREAVRFTLSLCAELARAGVVVASGGAAGIDTAAHLGALEHDARTLVVAPSGFERPFPKSNAELFRDIVKRGGGFVSEHTDAVAAQPHRFFRRNSLLVGVSDLVVVVEAAYRSGARNAAHWARKLGRPLFVVPHAPWNGRGRGWLEEHRLGAGLLVGSKDLLSALERRNLHAIPSALPELQLGLPGTQAPKSGSRRSKSTRDPVLCTVLGALEGGAADFDELVQRTGVPLGLLQAAVSELCLEELAQVSALGVVSRR